MLLLNVLEEGGQVASCGGQSHEANAKDPVNGAGLRMTGG